MRNARSGALMTSGSGSLASVSSMLKGTREASTRWCSRSQRAASRARADSIRVPATRWTSSIASVVMTSEDSNLPTAVSIVESRSE